MPVRDAGDQTLAASGAAVAPRHVVGDPGLVDEDEAGRVQPRLRSRQALRASALSGQSCSDAWSVFF
jgi:hypothetical protein